MGAGYTWSVRLSWVGVSSSSEADGLSHANAIYLKPSLYAYAGGSGATVDCRKGDHKEHIDFVNFLEKLGTKNERDV